MDELNQKPAKTILTLISIGFVIWSAAFIYRSSFLAVDGKRYFCLFDDAMISMRYAWNFSHGLGLVWNQGEYVQGYTNLLMTLLMSLATLIFDKSTAALFVQVLGVGLMLAIAALTLQIADYLVPNENRQNWLFIRILTFSCALFYYPLTYWTLMGMETGLLTMLLLLGILFAFKYTTSHRALDLFFISGALGLAYFTRNDSAIFALLIWAYLAWEIFIANPSAMLQSRRGFLAALSFYLVLIVGQLAFQDWYYGEALPNTYTLKLTGMPLFTRLTNGFGFIAPFLSASALLLVLSSLEVVFDFQRRKLLLISIVFSAIGYQVYIGGDPWNYWRIMSPTMPLLTSLFIIALHAVVLAGSSTQAFRAYFLRNPGFPEKYLTQILVVILTITGLLSVNLSFLPEISLLAKPFLSKNNQNNVNTAIVLSQLTTNEATVGVYWAGAIPYFADRKAIDFLGKSDPYIAQLPPDLSGAIGWSGMNSIPGHNKYDLYYSIKTLKPTYVQGFEWGTQNLSELTETKYVRVDYAGVSLFLLRDSPMVLWKKINAP
jgi:arabinofuranosyltransferase